MVRPRPPLTFPVRSSACLTLLLAAALPAQEPDPVPPPERLLLRQSLPRRAEELGRELLRRAPALGLAPETGFRELVREVDAWGETRVRFQQLHEGRPVWGAVAIAKMDRVGRLGEPSSSLVPGIRLASGPDIGGPRAIQEVLDDLALSFQAEELAPPTAEPIVFPAFRQGWLAYEPGPEPGLYRLDPHASVLSDPLTEPFVPAYLVRTRHQDPVRGLLVRETVVDARTGQILRKDPGLRFLEGPMKIPGRTQYSGEVLLDAVRTAQGNVLLRDVSRPTRAHPSQASILGDSLYPGNAVYTTWTMGASRMTFGYSTQETAFGDGQPYNYLAAYTHENLLGSNGQTAAADVAYGMQVTWDLMAQVLGRSGGPLGNGEALLAQVHAYGGLRTAYANAQWDATPRIFSFGDGGSGTLPFTPLDVVAHELGHALMTATANVIYEGEPGGISEANSDIFAAAAKAYALAGASGNALPAVLPDELWLLGTQIYPEGSSTTFIRSMMKPSLAYIPDAWFDGIGIPGVYHASGPVSRFFYFLSEGCLPGDERKGSVFLTQGMAGIGMRKALAVWYRALSAHVADATIGHHGMRTATEAAARDLHGEGSAEYRAVQNAWAAVGVGPAAGQATAPRLMIDPGPFPEGVLPGAWIQAKSRDVFVGFGSAAPLPLALAENFPSPPVLRWSSSFAQVDNTAGTIRPSIWNFLGWSTSFELQAEGTPHHAQAMLNPVVLDLDGDGEADASDAAVMAIYAMTGYLPSEVFDPVSLQKYLPPPIAIYRWNRAFEGLAATGGK